ncbi:hypothetical protein JKP88DRAFT_312383 [Tribonema minus]|uniref:LysM domain-containing protein n=1 Tax=Tribonema minus TaxID=303371 RepID=A0A835Z1D4_9STRA|nr:hypothetical protein JKP88DRAFT_312383 [Tribonema minus]
MERQHCFNQDVTMSCSQCCEEPVVSAPGTAEDYCSKQFCFSSPPPKAGSAHWHKLAAASEYSATPPLTPCASEDSYSPVWRHDSGEPQRSPQYSEHTVTSSDTLAGLCLRYRTTPRELRRLNNFSGDCFGVLKVLVVPERRIPHQQQQLRDGPLPLPTESPSAARPPWNPAAAAAGAACGGLTPLGLARQLARETGVAEARAWACLDAHGWRLDAARATCRSRSCSDGIVVGSPRRRAAAAAAAAPRRASYHDASRQQRQQRRRGAAERRRSSGGGEGIELADIELCAVTARQKGGCAGGGGAQRSEGGFDLSTAEYTSV